MTLTADTKDTETKTNDPRATSLTPEQRAAILAAAGRHKDNPEYLRTWDEGVAEYRRQLQEQYERELADEKGK